MAVPSHHHPAPLRWLIGAELTRIRKEARLSVAKAATLTDIGAPKIGHMENGRQAQTEQDIATLLSAYGADPRSITRLSELNARTEEANWWKPWTDTVPPWFSLYVGLERVADRSFQFELDTIPGLLQSPDYASAMTNKSMLVRADRTQRVVDFRMARRARLTDADNPLWLHAVVTTWGLEAVVGSSEVHEAQLLHLLKMAELPSVTLQVLRPQDGPLGVNAGKFTLLSFGAAHQLCYVELVDDAIYYYDQPKLRTYQLCADDLQRIALSPERSLTLIRKMVM
jgi:transcriptional regulator with XRE-family HTH domain